MSNEKENPVSLPGFSPGLIVPHKLADKQATHISDMRQLTFHYMQEGFSIVATNGLHVDVNPAFCHMTGFSREELIGFGPEDSYWPPEKREQMAELISKALRGEFADIELIFMRKNGERFPVLMNPFPIRDGGGEIVYFGSTVKDITQRTQMQLTLQESEERYRRLFESAADAIVILLGEKIIDCNEKALEVFGVTSIEQLAARSTFDLFPAKQPDGSDSRAFSIEKLKGAAAGKPQFFSWHHVKVDGTPFEAEVSLSTFKLGESTFIQAIIRDVTQRKRMEEALRRNERQYRALFEHAGDGILIMDDESVVDCNERVLDIYGITREQLMRQSDYALSPPVQPNGQTSREFYHERISALQSADPQSFEWHATKFDGTPIETEVTLAAYHLDGKRYTQSIIRDTTQRKRMEAAVRDSDVRFRVLFENAGDAIVILKDNKIIDCNARTLQLYGHSHEEILQNPATAFFPVTQPNGQASNEFFDEKIEASYSEGPQVFEWAGQKSDGTTVFTEVTLTTFMLNNSLYSQSIGRDITERKKMETALLDLNRTLEQRVTQRTEELEKACAELLQRNAQFRALASKLTRAEEEERRRIARLLHDNHQQLLVAAKFKAEILVSHLYGSDVNAAGAQIVEILDQALEVTRSLTMELAPPILYGAGFVTAMEWLARWMEEHHQLDVVVIGALPVTPLPADVSGLLFRAVRELLFNVSKHAGVKRANVNIVAFDQGLRVTVSDEGVGFNVTEVLQTPRSYGLFSIQEQLSALDGRLDISSGPQRGTVCALSIPVPTADSSQPAISAAADMVAPEVAVTAHAPRRPIRILVADDHALARGALVEILGLVDDFVVVGAATDGLDAVEKTRLLKPDVVLMDATMPKLNGLEATRHIMKEFPQAKVIGLSMHAREDMEPQMTAAGAACYLQKLSPVDELFAAIRGSMASAAAGVVE